MLKIINLAENNKFIDFAINQFNQLANKKKLRVKSI